MDGGGLGGFRWTAEEASTIGGIATVSLLHSFIPTHWLPFSIVARAQRWPLSRTLLVTAFGGVLHVVSTALLGITAVTMANTISLFAAACCGFNPAAAAASTVFCLYGLQLQQYFAAATVATYGQPNAPYSWRRNSA